MNQATSILVTGMGAALHKAMQIQWPATEDRVFPAVFIFTVEAKSHILNPLECGGCNT